MAAVGQGNVHLCAGALVNSGWIAVAAHCIVGLHAKTITIKIGVLNVEVLFESMFAAIL